MPDRFSFVIPHQLAGMACPGTWQSLEQDLRALKRESITAIVSLTEQGLNEGALRKAGFTSLHLPVMDFSPPRPAQIDKFVAFTANEIKQGGAVAVHCTAGIGRTGTMLACYLVSLGESALEAIESVRMIRPGSIETPEQEQAIHEYAARVADAK